MGNTIDNLTFQFSPERTSEAREVRMEAARGIIEAKGDKTNSICNSCINYCEKSFRLGSAHGLSIGVRHHAYDLLFPILALAAFATFVSAVCNRS